MFDNIKKNFGFGCMRMPLKDGDVDHDIFSRMIDIFMENGFNYFDTAHGYIDGKSETAIKKCLTSRYPRESYILTNKLSSGHFEKNEDILPLFESQLEACGVEYFDFYLMHAQNRKLFEQYKACNAYETAIDLRNQGRIKHLGISFHDNAETLDMILSEYPQIEVVQIQFNYADFDDELVQSKKCYDVCRKHDKPVIIMEPVKGGRLVKLPTEAEEVFSKLNNGSCASYAIRFAASFEGVMMVLSGMSSVEMVQENCGFMKDFAPLNEKEMAAIEQVREIFRNQEQIPCTNCRYCLEVCPQGVLIPDLFECLNAKRRFDNMGSRNYYKNIHKLEKGKASTCIKCGKCEDACPQKITIRRFLEEVVQEFEN